MPPKISSLRGSFTFLFSLLLFNAMGCSESNIHTSTEAKKAVPLWGDAPFEKPSCVKGVHLTAWFAGNKQARAKIEKLLEETELNTIVIDIKEIQGDVYIPGVPHEAAKVNFVDAAPDIKEYLQYLKERGVYTIARLVVFKDSRLPREKPDWAVRSSSPMPLAVEKGYQPGVWVDKKGIPWADPYNPWVWRYNIDIAERAIDLGFQEVQFDYIRFPSDGDIGKCVYSKPHNKNTAPRALAMFLERARERLKPKGARISIDVFGLVGSSSGDMGIGQKLSVLLSNIDALSPMMYPSHYALGELGVKNPNRSPYDILFQSIRDTEKVLAVKPVVLRPYLQDFSLGVKYTAKEVRDQIQAANDLGVNEWILWNPSCHYTQEALLPDPRFTPPEKK